MDQTEDQIRTPGAIRTSIPIMRTSFIGRKREMEEIKQLLASSRLVTLTGAAGCGKTRLALRAAASTGNHTPDGVYWVELARLADPALIPQTIAKGLHISEGPDRPSLDRLVDALQDRQLLLVLDNCEHLLSACARLVETLLAKTEVRVLATTREPLGVVGEMLYPVAPLSLPPPDLPADDVAKMGQFDAIQLFVERARAILPAFELTVDNAGVVASICRNIDGIPLAIELASARINVLTAGQIAARLDDHFKLLTPAAHLTHSHHDTLRAAIDWSYDLLSQPEQIMLRRLSVFAGGCSLETAETVCAGDGLEREQVLELLSSLVSKSLVTAQTLQRGEARYSLLETIRQYAAEKLLDSGEWSAMRGRHLDCFLQLAGETEPKLIGPYQQLWLNWLEVEFDNIRAALAWSLASDQIEEGLRIVVDLYQFWTIRDYVEEGLNWFEQLLTQANEGISPVVGANAFAYASVMAGRRGRTEAQMRYANEAALLGEAAGEEGKQALAIALGAQAWVAQKAGDYQTALTLGLREIQLLRELEDLYMLGLSLSLHSFAAMSLGKYDVAQAMLDEGLPLLRETGNPYRIAMALNYSGDLARCMGDYAQAQTVYEESLSLLRQIDAERDQASVLHNLGHAYLHLGDVERAWALFDESMALHQEQGNRPGMAECLIGFAALSVVWGLPAAGARLLTAAETIGGQQITSEWAATRLEYEGYLARARDGLTEEVLQAEQMAGRALSLDQAVAYGRDIALKAAATQKAQKELEALTPREREVAALIAQARSNEEIAEQLVVSKRTVESHIANIRSKLGFTNRAQIVRWAIETGLVQTGG